MHAVIKTGGKQYRVKSGDTLKIEKLEAEIGASIEFDQVLMVTDEAGTQVGNPVVSGVKVVANVISQGRAKKIRVIHFKRRKHHLKRRGHRQYYTQIQIVDIAAA